MKLVIMRHKKISSSLSPSNFDSNGSVSSHSQKTYRPTNLSKQKKENLNKGTLSKSEQEKLKSEVSLLIGISYVIVLIILVLLGKILFGEISF